MTKAKFRKGQRVVPLKKTIGMSLDDCDVWKKAKELGQNFLYVIENSDNRYDLHYLKDANSIESLGFFCGRDLISYKEWLESHTPDGSNIAMTDKEIEVAIEQEIKVELSQTAIEMSEWIDGVLDNDFMSSIIEEKYVENGRQLTAKINKWKNKLLNLKMEYLSIEQHKEKHQGRIK